MTALYVGDPRCPQCKDDGKCVECDGTGVNIHLNEDERKCKTCEGTGACSACNGAGRFLSPPTPLSPGLEK